MIAVEWEHRDTKGVDIQRCGMLLQVTRADVGGHGTKDISYVITRRMDGDPWVRGPVVKDQYPMVILRIDTDQLRVKGVHIPFEPHGAEK